MKVNSLNPNKRNKKSVFITLFIIYPLLSLKAETFTNTEGIQFNGEIQRVEQDGVVIQTDKELKKIKFKRLQQNLVFTNTEGIQYTGKIQRVEPDGIVIQTEGGIEKVKFKKLPQDIALKYGYNPSSENRFIEEQINQKNILNRQILQ